MRYAAFCLGLAGCAADPAFAELHDSGDSGGSDDSGDSGDSGDGTGTTDAMQVADAEPTRDVPADLAGEACGLHGRVRTCGLDPDDIGEATAIGEQACGSDLNRSALVWSACMTSLPCIPGEEQACGPPLSPTECVVTPTGDLEFAECGFTPLAVDLSGDGISLQGARGPAFDIAANGACFDVDWPGIDDPWLVIDRDADGAITDGSELFGSGTTLANGQAASNGFVALASLDTDGDGAITPRDAAFSRLALWSDLDGDRRGTGGELVPLAAFGITSLPLAYRRDRVCDARENCVIERAMIDTIGGAAELVDVHLACQ